MENKRLFEKTIPSEMNCYTGFNDNEPFGLKEISLSELLSSLPGEVLQVNELVRVEGLYYLESQNKLQAEEIERLNKQAEEQLGRLTDFEIARVREMINLNFPLK